MTGKPFCFTYRGMETITTKELLGKIRSAVKKKGLTELAKEIGFSRQFVNNVLQGDKEISKNLAAAFGYKKIKAWQPVKRKQDNNTV